MIVQKYTECFNYTSLFLAKGSPTATFTWTSTPVVILTLSLRSIASITTGILCSYARKMMIFLVFLNFTI